jgi:hypothetical protein
MLNIFLLFLKTASVVEGLESMTSNPVTSLAWVRSPGDAYNRNFDLISKFNSDLKTLLRQGISQPGFYGEVVYKLRKILGHGNFSAVFTKLIKRFIKRGYDPTILRHTACLVFNPFTVGHYAFLF